MLASVVQMVFRIYDVWGELDSHKRSSTHHPISQGWAVSCSVLFVCLGWVVQGLFGLGEYFFLIFPFSLVCYTHLLPCIPGLIAVYFTVSVVYKTCHISGSHSPPCLPTGDQDEGWL